MVRASSIVYGTLACLALLSSGYAQPIMGSKYDSPRILILIKAPDADKTSSSHIKREQRLTPMLGRGGEGRTSSLEQRDLGKYGMPLKVFSIVTLGFAAPITGAVLLSVLAFKVTPSSAHGINTYNSSGGGGFLLCLGVSALVLITFALTIGALVQAVWFRNWKWRIGILGALVFVHTLLWIMSLSHIPATPVLIFTQCCDVWAADMVRFHNGRKSAGQSISIVILISFLPSVASGPTDITSSFLSRHSSSA
ncbi:unnamed protein product [Tilletia caries]|nr:unnamed protein product [Tilletia caries]